jgi:hypothetical protein
MTNSFLPCLPFQTVHLPPSVMATFTLPALGGIFTLAIIGMPSVCAYWVTLNSPRRDTVRIVEDLLVFVRSAGRLISVRSASP